MSKDRFYFNGKRHVPSGTTVIGLLDKPALVPWAANCAVDYVIRGAKISSKVTKEGDDLGVGKVTEYQIFDWDVNDARTAYKQESTEAADYGTYIHKLCEVSLTDDIQIDSPHDMTQKFMDGLWLWKTKHNVKVIAMEHEVLSEWYGGRLDLVCEMDSYWMTKAWCKKFGVEWYKGINKQRVIVLVDFKTGKGAYYDTWKYQLAGYRQAYDSSIPWTTRTEDLLVINGLMTTCDVSERIGEIQHHGILKFNKETMKVNYKDFTEWQTTRTNPETLEKEKYIRTYETDRATFNSLVANWWLTKRGIQI